jgi:hypothetical protein
LGSTTVFFTYPGNGPSHPDGAFGSWEELNFLDLRTLSRLVIVFFAEAKNFAISNSFFVYFDFAFLGDLRVFMN